MVITVATLEHIATILLMLTIVACAVGWLVGPVHRIRTARRRAKDTTFFDIRPRGVREANIDQLVSLADSLIGASRTRGSSPFTNLFSRLRNAQPGFVVHRLRVNGVLRTYLGVYGSPHPQTVAESFARAACGEAIPCDVPELPDGARAIARRTGIDAMVGTPIENVHRLGDFLAEELDEGMCFSFVMEPVAKWEMLRLRALLHSEERAQASSTASMGSIGPATARITSDQTMRMFVVATAPDASEAQMLIGSFGGHLDAQTQTIVSENPTDFNRGFATCAALTPFGLLWWQVFGDITVALAVAFGGGVMLILSALGILNLTRTELNVALGRGLLVAQTPQWFNPRWILGGWVRADFRDRNAVEGGRQKSGRVAHPHPRRLLIASARQLLGLISFPSSSSTAVAAASTKERPAPSAVTVQSGIRAGVDASGRAVWLPEADRQWGVFAVGDPGTGKTTWLMNLYWADLIDRLEAKARGGTPKSIFWIETKGEGARRALEIARRAHYTDQDIALINAASATGPRLDLIDWSDPNRGATLLVEMMRYAYSEGDIQERAANVLHAAFRLAIACPPDVTRELGWDTDHPNVIRLAFWLLGGEPHTGKPQQAYSLLREAAEREEGPSLVAAAHGSGFAADFAPSNPMIEQNPMISAASGPVAEAWKEFSRYTDEYMTKRDLVQITESSKNKLEGLLTAPHLWEPSASRHPVTLRALLSGGWPAILNFGPPGGDQGQGYADLVATRMAAMAMYALWDAIKQECDGWQAQGRAVAVYSDELHDIAGTGTGDDVVRGMADQGRSRGVQLVLATQRYTQLPELTRESCLSFGTRVYFRLSARASAEEAAADIGHARDGGFAADEIRDLPERTGACRMRRDGKNQPAFTIRAIRDDWLDPSFRHSATPRTDWHPEHQ